MTKAELLLKWLIEHDGSLRQPCYDFGVRNAVRNAVLIAFKGDVVWKDGNTATWLVETTTERGVDSRVIEEAWDMVVANGLENAPRPPKPVATLTLQEKLEP